MQPKAMVKKQNLSPKKRSCHYRLCEAQCGFIKAKTERNKGEGRVGSGRDLFTMILISWARKFGGPFVYAMKFFFKFYFFRKENNTESYRMNFMTKTMGQQKQEVGLFS